MHCVACDALLPNDTARCPRCRQNPFLAGKYRLEEQLGHGASGTVYLASDIQGSEKLAIKELPYRHSLPPKRMELLEREASVLRQLSHPAIPRFIDTVIAGEGKARALYLIQEFVEGETLAAHLPSHRYTEAEVCDILVEISEILAYLHGLSPPVVHRDIKPSNLMRRPDGSIALIDFGSVQDALQDPELGGSTVAGTFGYMAPEQFLGETTPATDYYGLGATAVALLSRQDPTSLQDRPGALKWERVIAPSPQMAQLLRRLLNDDPEQRLSSPEQLKHILRSPAVAQPASAAAAAPLLARGQLKDARPEPLTELLEPDQAVATVPNTAAALSRGRAKWMAALMLLALSSSALLFVLTAPSAPVLPVLMQDGASSPDGVVSAQWRDVTPIHRVTPSFPGGAAQSGAPGGSCDVRISIDEQGKPYDVLIESCPEVYHDSVREASLQWRFEPYLTPEGIPIKSNFVYQVTFKPN